MINYLNSSPDLSCELPAHASASIPEAAKEALSDAEPWTLLALRAEWLGRMLRCLAQLEGAQAGAVEMAYALELRRKIARSGMLAELLHCLEQAGGDVDHKRWARKIIARIAAGDLSVRPYQARAALDALCAPD